MLQYLYLFKALHLVGMVAWFAGLFYLVRIFVYHVEAMEKAEPERSILTQQFNLMEWRVYKIICTPAMNMTWLFGILMIVAYGMDWFKVNSWLHSKLVLVVLLSTYQVYMKRIIQQLEQGKTPYTSYQFRLLNEVPTLFLLSIVLLAVYKNGLNTVYAIAGILLFGILLMAGTKFYKKIRERGKG